MKGEIQYRMRSHCLVTHIRTRMLYMYDIVGVDIELALHFIKQGGL